MRWSALVTAGILLLKRNATSEEGKNYHWEEWLGSQGYGMESRQWDLMAVAGVSQRGMQQPESQVNLGALVKPRETRSCIKQPPSIPLHLRRPSGQVATRKT